MARIAGVDLPRRKAIAYALPYIYGIGPSTARTICKQANIPETRKVDELSEADVKAIRDAIDASIKVEGAARRRRGVASRTGARAPFGRGVRQGPRRGPRKCAARAAAGRLQGHADSRRDADPPQRLPAAQAPSRVTGTEYGSVYWCSLQA